MNKPSIRDAKLYVIVDRAVLAGRDPVQVAGAAIRGGAQVIQWRDKLSPDLEFRRQVLRLKECCGRSGTLFIVNDRLEAARDLDADGVHVGDADLPIREVRAQWGTGKLIGRSTHSLDEALQAEADGADYLGVGPVFATPTKPAYRPVGLELVRQAASSIRIPWFAIGGIDLRNLPLVLSAGAARVAVVRSVAAASDPEAAAHAFRGLLP